MQISMRMHAIARRGFVQIIFQSISFVLFFYSGNSVLCESLRMITDNGNRTHRDYVRDNIDKVFPRDARSQDFLFAREKT